VGATTFDNIVNRTWCPALEITGAGDLPALDAAGNVLRPRTSLKLSLRLPPTLDATWAGATLARILQTDPPYQARVSYEAEWEIGGWQSPPFSGWLDSALQESSTTFFDRPAIYASEGFSIPFMPALVQAFPDRYPARGDRRTWSTLQCPWTERVSRLGHGEAADYLCRRDCEPLIRKVAYMRSSRMCSGPSTQSGHAQIAFR